MVKVVNFDDNDNFEQILAMSVLQEIFANVQYEEVSPLFDEMDSMFLSLTDGYEQGFTDEMSDEELTQTLERLLSVWNERILRQVDQWHGFFETGRSIAIIINSSIRNENTKSYGDAKDGIEALMQWVNYREDSYTFTYVAYFSQRMSQLRKLVELYQKEVSRQTITQRHLFETGLRKAGVPAERYLSIVFDQGHAQDFRRGDIQSLLKYVSTRHNGNVPAKHINWIGSTTRSDEIEERLSQKLKYADLAYKRHLTKGILTEVLDRYKVHFGMYKGVDIKGRFHLQGDLNGFIGSLKLKPHTIIIGFSGTASVRNCITDIRQYFGCLDPVYVQALGLVRAVWAGKRHKKGFRNAPIEVCGHSLGGGLMQFAVASMNTDGIMGFGYNSAGLSKRNVERLPRELKTSNIYHLYLPYDVVFRLPFAYQLGESVRMRNTVLNPKNAHKLGFMRANLRTHRHEVAKLG